MPVRFRHDQKSNSVYFITFTCYKWRNLFQIADTYNAVYKWFDYLIDNTISVAGNVILPNHLHVLLYFPEMPRSLNTVTGNAKRFMAYEIIKKHEAANNNDLLELLQAVVKKKRAKKMTAA